MPDPQMLRPMKFSEVIDQTFRLYRRSFLLLFGIGAVFYVPTSMMTSTPNPWVMIPGVVLTYAFMMLATGAITKAVSDRYLGQPATIGGSYRFVAGRLGALLLTTILVGLFIIAGMVLLIVPGIIFSLWVSFVVPILLIEGRAYTRAIERSRYLVGQGVWGRVLLMTTIVSVITSIVQVPLTMPLQMASTWLNMPSLMTLSGLFGGVAQAATVPIGQVGLVLLYYDSRMRKEGFDLEILARELGERAAAISESPPDVAEPPAEPPPPESERA